MTSTTKWIFIVTGLVIIGFVLYFSFIMGPAKEKITPSAEKETLKVEEGEEPTGNIDETIDTILDSAISEKTIYDEEDRDAQAIMLDEPAINEFGQSYEETEL